MKWAILASVFILTLQNTKYIECYRILGIFPHPGMSHFHFFHPLMRGLALAGHDVTVASRFPDKNPVANYTDYKISGMEQMVDWMDLKWFGKRKWFHHFGEFFMLYEWGMESCKTALYSEAISEILKTKEQFDVILLEYFNTDCMMGVSHLLKAPVIGLSSSGLLPWYYQRVGNPFVPSYTPLIFLQVSEKMGFFERTLNLISYAVMNLLYKLFTQRSTNKMLRERFGKTMPDITELVHNTSLILINEHHSLSGIQPLSAGVIELGGLHIQEPKPLDKKLQKMLDAAKDGVIYISWGSMIRSDTLPLEKREAILKAVTQFKETILWKWENDTLPNQPSNVFIRKWMPQREILCHPNVKAYWAHGGLLGSSEGAYCGVPMVITPMFGDQFYNAAKLQNRGMGVILYYEEITEDSVYNALKQALSPETTYNAKKVSYSFKNRPQNPMDTAIWWIEHVIKSGGSPLTHSHSTYLPWYILYSFDVYIFILLCLSLQIAILVKFIKWYRSRKAETNKTKVQ